MITVSSVLWEANDKSERFSRCYTDLWAIRLFNGFRRNLTIPSRFVLFTDRKRDLPKHIEQIVQPDLGSNGYGDCVRPFELNEPMIFVGLDTVIVGNIDHLAEYCLSDGPLALPRDPYAPEQSCNGVALVPAGQQRIFNDWHGENDMEWLRKQPHVFADDLFPGEIVSFKRGVQKNGLGNARIVYFHGVPKMQDLEHLDWVREHWV